MDVPCIRHFWSLVEETPAQVLLRQENETLTLSLLGRLCAQRFYSPHEIQQIDSYIRSRLPLIRDLASRRHRSMVT
ncbi:MAG: hypothetical protein AAGA75_27980 [Cyanobacteria bacterium P01_E01_bin.6]